MTEHQHPDAPDAAEAAEVAAEEAVESVEATEVPAARPEAAATAEALERAAATETAEGGDEEPETLAVPLAELRPALEAVLMVADQPLDQVTLATAVGYPVAEVVAALEDLARGYSEQGRGFDLRNVAGGWRYYTRDEYAPVVEKFVLEGQQARLTQAALETLAVVAYKQPVSRARVSAVRGVNVDGVMRTLLARGLVEECGHDEETSAILYRTTSYFLERIGITSVEELPELAPFLPEIGDLDEFDEHPAAAPVGPVATASPDESADESADAPADDPEQP